MDTSNTTPSIQLTGQISGQLSEDSPVTKIMISCGEASGDLHAAGLATELRQIDPSIYIFGMGGRHSREAGVDTVVDSETAAGVMGVAEVVGKLHSLIQARRTLIEKAIEERPQVLVLIDFPDFNFLIGRALKPMGIKVLYFVCPQIWAWRKGRVKFLQKYTDKLALIFPFEEKFYRTHGLAAEYVGHPFLLREKPYSEDITTRRASLANQFQAIPSSISTNGAIANPVLAILPGSRKAEINHILPELVKTWSLLAQNIPDLQTYIPVAEALDIEWIKSFFPAQALEQSNAPRFVKGTAQELLYAADFAIVTSGTATVEAALAETPFVVVYKMSPLTFFLGKLLIKGVKHIAMPNLIAEKEVVKEYLQDALHAETIANFVTDCLKDNRKLQSMRAELALVRNRLEAVEQNHVNPYRRVADMALELTHQK